MAHTRRKKTDFQVAFGKRVRTLRKRAGYSQESFAAHAGIDRSQYGCIERGEDNATLATVERIAAGLDKPALELFRFPKKKP